MAIKEPYRIYEGFCPITPVPKGRPRFSAKTHSTYTPAATRKYEDAVRRWFMAEYGKDRAPMDGYLSVYYEFVLERPKSTPKSKRMSNTKPDIDNFIKAFQDAFDFKIKDENGTVLGVIANDSRVSAIQAQKRYAVEGERTGTYFKIRSAVSDVIIYSDVGPDMLGLLDMTKRLVDLRDLPDIPADRDVRNVYLFFDTDDIDANIYALIEKKFPCAVRCLVI